MIHLETEYMQNQGDDRLAVGRRTWNDEIHEAILVLENLDGSFCIFADTFVILMIVFVFVKKLYA